MGCCHGNFVCFTRRKKRRPGIAKHDNNNGTLFVGIGGPAAVVAGLETYLVLPFCNVWTLASADETFAETCNGSMPCCMGYPVLTPPRRAASWVAVSITVVVLG